MMNPFLQEARYYHANHLQDVSYSVGGKILSYKPLAMMNPSLEEARYYHASHLQDVSYSAGGKILSCKLLAKCILFCVWQDTIMQATCKMILYKNTSY